MATVKIKLPESLIPKLQQMLMARQDIESRIQILLESAAAGMGFVGDIRLLNDFTLEIDEKKQEVTPPPPPQP